MTQNVFSIQAKLQSGFAFHQEGRLREAEGLYQEVLRSDKRNVDALHLIGVIYHQTGRHEEAVDFISRAIKLNPGAAIAYYNRGNALKALGRNEEAVANFSKAVALNPQYVDAYNNRGTTLNDLHRFREALESCDKAIALKPEFAEAYNNRGISLRALGRPGEAVASYNKAISLQPRNAEAHNNRALALGDLQRFDEALAGYDKVLEIQPRHAEAHNNRGNVFMALARLEEALASYDRAIDLKPDYFEAYSNQGNVLHALKRGGEALASYDKAIEINPHYAKVHNNRGNTLRLPLHLEESLASFDRAIALNPNFAEAFANRGKVLASLRRFDEALASFDRAIELNPDFAGAHFNKAQFHLLFADFSAGWSLYEWRKSIEVPAGNRSYSSPLLTALDDAQGKTVLVHWEQGLGDTIQFCRYAGLLADRAAKVLFAPQPALKPLMQSLDARVELVDADDPPAGFDCHVPLLSLPGFFETRLETIPAKPGYLSADPGLIAAWQERLAGAGLKIGICWQGNANNSEDSFRSFPASLLAPLAGIENVRLINLQTGSGAGQLQKLPGEVAILTFAEDDFAPFAHTAAMIANLDLVITADTSIAHLAGALGVPTWVALGYVPEWRWMLDRPDSPWYPSMRLFRQNTNRDWNGVFDDIRAALLEWVGGKSI